MTRPRRFKRNGYIKGIYGRLRYAPVDNVVILVILGGVWAYKPLKKYEPAKK